MIRNQYELKKPVFLPNQEKGYSEQDHPKIIRHVNIIEQYFKVLYHLKVLKKPEEAIKELFKPPFIVRDQNNFAKDLESSSLNLLGIINLHSGNE